MRMPKTSPWILVAALALPLASMAQPQGRGEPMPGPHGQDDRRDQGPDRGPDRRAPAPVREAHADPRHELRGAGPDHAFKRGARLPREYRNHQYVVDDWRGHRLNRPPRGYHWVQTGADYVLISIATGVIAQVLMSQ